MRLYATYASCTSFFGCKGTTFSAHMQINQLKIIFFSLVVGRWSMQGLSMVVYLPSVDLFPAEIVNQKEVALWQFRMINHWSIGRTMVQEHGHINWCIKDFATYFYIAVTEHNSTLDAILVIGNQIS